MLAVRMARTNSFPLLVAGGSRVLGRDVFERGRGVKKSAPVWGASNGIGAKTASLSGIRL